MDWDDSHNGAYEVLNYDNCDPSMLPNFRNYMAGDQIRLKECGHAWIARRSLLTGRLYWERDPDNDVAVEE